MICHVRVKIFTNGKTVKYFQDLKGVSYIKRIDCNHCSIYIFFLCGMSSLCGISINGRQKQNICRISILKCFVLLSTMLI